MAHFYSPSTGQWYDDRLSPEMPDDAVRVAPARKAELFAAQASGATIVPGTGGKPRAVRPEGVRPREQLLRAIKREANRRILTIAPVWRQLNDMRLPDNAPARSRTAAIDAVRAASEIIERDLAETDDAALPAFPVSEHPLWPEV